jgi:hypothetical protein
MHVLPHVLTLQLGGTPASALSSAVGSVIRDIGSAGRMGALDRGLSPAMPSGLPNVSPTLNLLPNLGDGTGLGQVSAAGIVLRSLGLHIEKAAVNLMYRCCCR